jgi:hypothetical protein
MKVEIVDVRQEYDVRRPVGQGTLKAVLKVTVRFRDKDLEGEITLSLPPMSPTGPALVALVQDRVRQLGSALCHATVQWQSAG